MYIDTSYLISRKEYKLLELETVDFKPEYLRLSQIDHIHELINIYKNVSIGNANVTDLAYKLIYDWLWWPRRKTMDDIIVSCVSKIPELELTTRDSELITKYCDERNLVELSTIFNKYITYDRSKRLTLRELVTSNETYTDIYNHAVKVITNKMTKIKNDNKDMYELICEDCELRNTVNIYQTAEEYSYAVNVPAGVIIEGLSTYEPK